MIFQQGDLILTKIDTLPDSAKLLKGESVLHPGNTGNKHELSGNAFGIYANELGKFVDTLESTRLTHNEHNTINLPAGKYALTFVSEFDHFQQLKRAVVD